MLRVNPTNPNDQAVVGNIRGLFNPRAWRLLLLDWITYHNLPFHIVDSERFQRLLFYGNPVLEKKHLPSSNTLITMLVDEYKGAIGPVTETLRSARSMIHYTFDSWT